MPRPASTPRSSGIQVSEDDAAIARRIRMTAAVRQPRVRFDVIVALATIYTAFMAPFQAAFGNVHELQAVEALTEALFVLHIWTEFRTAFEDPHKPGELISSLPRIARRYCRGWFLPDAVASFPFEILLVVLEAVAHSSIGSVNTSNVLRALAVLRVLRLLRVGRLWVIARRLKVTAFVRLARLLFSFVLGAHIIACLFWSLPYLERYSGQYASLPPLLQAGPQSWAEMNGLMDESVAARTQYTFSIYWTVATLVSVGYGDVHAVSVGEQAFSVVVMTAGAITYSVLFGSVATLLASLNAHEAKFRQKIDAVDAFMRELRLPKRLQQRVRSYFDFSFSRQIEGRAVLEELPVTLQGEILDWAHRQMLLQCPATSSAEPQFIQLLSLKLEQVIALPDEFIFSAGDAATELFWVKEGEVVILNGGVEEGAMVSWLPEEEEEEEDDDVDIDNVGGAGGGGVGVGVGGSRAGAGFGFQEPTDGWQAGHAASA
ncbi:hypothetical protein FNF27_05172 [Cafeteria roenbergensis]|uniref:Ion transport domain-containing protein n=1 Tax=Cafeteria roenbergensis TaxID=33653 RepID=A0A5A8E6H7_CAFRO|nr:hypothetical protein FNF27_05172 [Cafeteria roenbergensis]